MPDRLRALLDRPLDPHVARAVLVLASAILVGFAAVALVGLGTSGDGHGPSTSSAHGEAMPAPSPARSVAPSKTKAPVTIQPQDPQDRSGTAAARAARRELRSHGALQHVPYRDDGVSIDLVGARHGRAVLLVRGSDPAAARRGWQGFLDRYDDEGADYRPIFHVGGRNG